MPPVIQTKPPSAGRNTKPFSRSRVSEEHTSSSLTTDRSSTRTSSDCFKPPLKDISKLKNTAIAEKCVGTGNVSFLIYIYFVTVIHLLIVENNCKL